MYVESGEEEEKQFRISVKNPALQIPQIRTARG